jgi:hypothetical protein
MTDTFLVLAFGVDEDGVASTTKWVMGLPLHSAPTQETWTQAEDSSTAGFGWHETEETAPGTDGGRVMAVGFENRLEPALLLACRERQRYTGKIKNR